MRVSKMTKGMLRLSMGVFFVGIIITSGWAEIYEGETINVNPVVKDLTGNILRDAEVYVEFKGSAFPISVPEDFTGFTDGMRTYPNEQEVLIGTTDSEGRITIPLIIRRWSPTLEYPYSLFYTHSLSWTTRCNKMVGSSFQYSK